MLNQQQADQLHSLIGSPVWVEFLWPAMEQEAKAATEMLGLPREQRPPPRQGSQPLRGDYLRGYLAGIRFCAQRPQQLLQEWNTEQLREAQDEIQEREPLGSPYSETVSSP